MIARERRDADAKVAKLETRIAVLEAKQEHGIGEIIDLPSPISRRRRDALAAKCIQARIHLRVCELRVLAARTFVEIGRRRDDESAARS